jgi:cell wall-active antibiotic response 4TMS protein YvqF
MTDRHEGGRWGLRGPELFGIVLIVVGAVYFLGNAGVIKISWNLLWPVLIIGIGVVVVLSAVRPRGDRAGTADVPRDSVQQLELNMSLGAGTFALNGGATQLVEVRSNRDDIVTRVERNGPRTRVRLRQDGAWFPFGARGSNWQIRTAGDVATALTLSGGAGSFSLDLAAIRVVDAQISIGAAQIDIVLPHPTGEVNVRLSGGAASVTIHVPPGVEARVIGSGGLINVQGRGETPGYGTSRDRVNVTVSGGATSVRVV